MPARVVLLIGLLGRASASAQDKPPADKPMQDKPAEPGDKSKSQEQGQETPRERSAALEDLLRRLQAERAQPSIAQPPTPVAPTAAPTPGLDLDSTAPRLYRAADTIEVMQAGRRRVLTWWDQHLFLLPGDEVRQAGDAKAVLEWPDGAHDFITGQAVWRVYTDAKTSPRQITVLKLARFGDFYLGRGDVDTVVDLPGGNQLAGRGAHVAVRDWDGRALEVKNSGPEPVVLRCPYLEVPFLTLVAGKVVRLPALLEPSAYVANLSHAAETGDDARGRLTVRAPDEVALTIAGDAVNLQGHGVIPGIARACGARLFIEPGAQLRLVREPLGTPRRQEWSH